MVIDSWNDVQSATDDARVDLAGVVSDSNLCEGDDGERLQELYIDEPPQETMGDEPSCLVLIAPYESRQYRVGEVVSFEGEVVSVTNGLVAVEGAEVSPWFDSGEL